MQVKMHIFYGADCHNARKNAYKMLPMGAKARKNAYKRGGVTFTLGTPPQPNVKKGLQNAF